MKLITQKEALVILGITRQRLQQIRGGWKKNKGGRTYTYPPLIEGVDYFWQRGHVVYNEETILKLKK